jgi:hypothetical protein
MQQLSAEQRREYIDWILFDSLNLYGDARDAPPTDCDTFFIHEWHGRSHTAQLRRAYLEALSDEELTTEALKYYERQQQIALLRPRVPGRPKGAGSLAEADRSLVEEISQLEAGGLSRHAAAVMVADLAAGGGTKESKARRLGRRILEKNKG